MSLGQLVGCPPDSPPFISKLRNLLGQAFHIGLDTIAQSLPWHPLRLTPSISSVIQRLTQYYRQLSKGRDAPSLVQELSRPRPFTRCRARAQVDRVLWHTGELIPSVPERACGWLRG